MFYSADDVNWGLKWGQHSINWTESLVKENDFIGMQSWLISGIALCISYYSPRNVMKSILYILYVGQLKKNICHHERRGLHLEGQNGRLPCLWVSATAAGTDQGWSKWKHTTHTHTQTVRDRDKHWNTCTLRLQCQGPMGILYKQIT